MPKGVKVKVNGDVVYETKDRVTDVSLQSPRGELSRSKIDFYDTEVNLVVHTEDPASVKNLNDVVEERRQADNKEREERSARLTKDSSSKSKK